MSLRKILLMLDSDPQPSVFDAVVAVDAGVDVLLRHGGVQPKQVRDLVYGCMFTRGAENLKNTAVFIGGADMAVGEALLKATTACFFGATRVSVMLDSNGSNTTAAAAVLAAGRHLPLKGALATVLAATGPVGRRVVRLLAAEGAHVRVCSRKLVHAEATCDRVSSAAAAGAALTPWATDSPDAARAAVSGAQAVIACGPPGVELLPSGALAASGVHVAIDLNAVPPVGVGDVKPADKAVERDGVVCYGALGVGGAKMKIHKAAIARLYQTHDCVLDAAEIYALGKQAAR